MCIRDSGWGSMGTLWTRPGKSGAVITVYLHPARCARLPHQSPLERGDARQDLPLLRRAERGGPVSYTHLDVYKRQYMGSHSGRDENKAKAAGLTPVVTVSYTHLIHMLLTS